MRLIYYSYCLIFFPDLPIEILWGKNIGDNIISKLNWVRFPSFEATFSWMPLFFIEQPEGLKPNYYLEILQKYPVNFT